VSDGTSALALPKAIQRDPVRDTFEHVDLLIVRRGEKVTVDVRVTLIGEPARDTLVMHEHQTLAIIADATRLPEHLEASIEGLEAGSHVTARQIGLPEGVELATDPELVLVVITAAPTAEQLAAEAGLPTEEEAAAEGAAGAEAAAEAQSAPTEAA
jgi:large subunit ribosomal protein L25